MNGLFLMEPTIPPAPPTIALASVGARPGEPPATLLAESLARQVAAAGRMTPAAQANLARDHGLALAALCGCGGAELARMIGRDPSTVRKIVRRVCEEAGIDRGASWDG